MRNIGLAALLITITAGTAFADRGRDHRQSTNNNGRSNVVVRDHRDTRYVEPRRTYTEPRRTYTEPRREYRRDERPIVRDNRSYRRDYRYSDRRPIYANNGRFVFNGGYERNYYRPIINRHYYDYRFRPQIIVENFDTVPGYIWVAGSWQWDGYEWQWSAGHYVIDPSFSFEYDGY